MERQGLTCPDAASLQTGLLKTKLASYGKSLFGLQKLVKAESEKKEQPFWQRPDVVEQGPGGLSY